MVAETCIGCALKTEKVDGPTHRYLGSSPGCWAKYGELLAKEYQHYQYMSVHNLTVDAYSLQHPGTENPQTISSANVHLASLYSYFELGKPVNELATLKKMMTNYKGQFTWLIPPDDQKAITVAGVLTAETAAEHCDLVEQWATYIFQQWKPHHPTIAKLLAIAYCD
ncbi:MAG: DUF5946 family protein [Chloroflexota bacterium]